MSEIRFRPHHFLCALCFKGNGYSPSFIANFSVIMESLNALEGEDTPIEIVKETDSICAPCPNRIEKTCTSEEKILTLDNAHAEALQLPIGQTITWRQAKEQIHSHLSLPLFEQICATCEWKQYGICEGVLRKFLGSS